MATQVAAAALDKSEKSNEKWFNIVATFCVKGLKAKKIGVPGSRLTPFRL
jgi:hypothetical protein